MHMRMTMLAALVALLLLAACGGAAPAKEAMPVATATEASAVTEAPAAMESTPEEAAPAEAMNEAAAPEDATSEEATSEEAVVESSDESADAQRPAWQQLPITNAQTGETFTLADFAGKTVYVEPFATWCTKCRQQLANVNQIRGSFGDDVVFVVLSVEPNIGNEALAQYATDQGFDMIFGAMSPELLRETVAIFGQTISNPPATPHFVIRADGSTTELLTGIEGPDEIAALIAANQG